MAGGALTLTDLTNLRAARRAQGLTTPMPCCVFDMRGSKLEFDLTAFKEHESETRAQHIAGERIALIMDEPVPTAMALAWARMMAGEVSVQVFSTVEAAYEWLGAEYRAEDLER